MSRAQELRAISKFIAKYGATRHAIYPEYDHIAFEDPRTICEAKVGRVRKGRTLDWADR